MNRRTLVYASALVLIAGTAGAAPTDRGLQGGAHHAGHPGTTSSDNVGGAREQMEIGGGRTVQVPARRSAREIRRRERHNGSSFESHRDPYNGCEGCGKNH